MAKNKEEQDKSMQDAVLKTARNTKGSQTDAYGKKLKTGKKALDPINGPKDYH